jgi:uncharacterized protein (DUF433 family)
MRLGEYSEFGMSWLKKSTAKRLSSKADAQPSRRRSRSNGVRSSVKGCCFRTLLGYTFTMLTVAPITHIRRDERGGAWIAETNTKVIEVALDQVAYGWDAEEIHAAHPHLSLAHIHAALSYYHDHKPEFDAQIKQQLEDHTHKRANAPDQLTRAELARRLSKP